MANIKITDLAAYTNPDSTDVLPIVDVGADVTKKVSVGEVVGKISGDVDVATDGASSIAAGVIVDADVNASAAIAGTKIDPDFGSQTVETTGVFSAAGGAEATPSITFTGDLNTGIYSPGANQLAISTNGAGALFIDSSGNVSVGTATANSVLHLASSNDPAITIADTSVADTHEQTVLMNNSGNFNIRTHANDGTFKAIDYIIDRGASGATSHQWRIENSEKMQLDSSGRLGLGTSSPDSLLHISGTSTSTTFSGPGTLNANRNYSGGVTQIVRNTSLTNGGFAGIQLTPLSSSGISQPIGLFAVSESPDFRSNFVITQRTDADTMTERFRIDSLGNVGIGTTSPNANLHVVGSTDGLDVIKAEASGSTGTFIIRPDGANGNQIRFGGSGANGNVLRFIGASDTERLRIDGSGRLLVGTSSASDDIRAVFSGRSGSVTGACFVRFSQGNTTPSNESTLGELRFTDSAAGVGASINTVVEGTWTSTSSHPTRLVFSVTADGASSPTEALRISNDRSITVSDGGDVVLGTTTGTKIGTATSQKIGFYNATPVVQPTAVADITTTATSGSLPTPDGSVTIADAATPTVTELLEYCVELEAKLEAALGHLRTLGLIAT